MQSKNRFYGEARTEDKEGFLECEYLGISKIIWGNIKCSKSMELLDSKVEISNG